MFVCRQLLVEISLRPCGIHRLSAGESLPKNWCGVHGFGYLSSGDGL